MDTMKSHRISLKTIGNWLVLKDSKVIAHFLLIQELLYSPPNDALIKAYIEQGYHVDVFAPTAAEKTTLYGEHVRLLPVNYTWIWIIKNSLSFRWFRYQLFSGTSEDPLAVIGILKFIYRRKSIALVDEIKSGSYRGDRSSYWKNLCKWSIRNASFSIVNDEHRVNLLRQYAGLKKSKEIIVYPGCFFERPSQNKDTKTIKAGWGFPSETFVIGSSGGFNLTAGADWLLNAVHEIEDICAVIQPLGVSELSLFLMESLSYSKRLYIEKRRLSWNEAWQQAKAFDIGLSIYSNPAPQFQNMGISSNRLCMFIAMGVPVIASRQESFNFLEDYNCGVLVSNFTEFKNAIQKIRSLHPQMKENCQVCFEDYIRPRERFKSLHAMIRQVINK